MIRAKTVEEYISKSGKWEAGLKILRSVLEHTELVETMKWGMPTYTFGKKNVVGFSAFKEHFGLWFFQGVFLSDPLKMLINAQEGKTRAMRQMRFTDHKDIEADIILSYIEEAIQNQKDGKEMKPERKPLLIPQLLQDAFSEQKELQNAFENLNLTRKREYAEYIESAKREETKLSRLQKIIPMIINGIGLNDKYRT
ncbi:MAG: hypothetical protein HKN67_06160 [Saprospiraceae bacterium]|nr:hypothetical protein [Saprospiraceae bacterium]